MRTPASTMVVLGAAHCGRSRRMPHARTHTPGSHPIPFAGGGNDVSSFRCLQIDSVTITKSLINALPSFKAIFFSG